jgi:hypothetical protein
LGASVFAEDGGQRWVAIDQPVYGNQADVTSLVRESIILASLEHPPAAVVWVSRRLAVDPSCAGLGRRERCLRDESLQPGAVAPEWVPTLDDDLGDVLDVERDLLAGGERLQGLR